MGADVLMWSIDHNTAVARAFEQKSQIYMGLLLLFIPLSNDHIAHIGLTGAYAVSVFASFAIAALLHLRVVSTVSPKSLKEIGETPLFLVTDTRLDAFNAALNETKPIDALTKELLKVSEIRRAKAKLYQTASLATFVAVLNLVACLAATSGLYDIIVSIFSHARFSL